MASIFNNPCMHLVEVGAFCGTRFVHGPPVAENQHYTKERFTLRSHTGTFTKGHFLVVLECTSQYDKATYQIRIFLSTCDKQDLVVVFYHMIRYCSIPELSTRQVTLPLFLMCTFRHITESRASRYSYYAQR